MAKKKTTIDDLAVMVKKGFDQMVDKATFGVFVDDVHKRFGSVDKRFETVEGDIKHIKNEIGHLKNEVGHLNASMTIVQHDIGEIRRHFVYRDEFEDALARIRLLEKKLGLKSGK
jgi:hypothetical protein